MIHLIVYAYKHQPLKADLLDYLSHFDEWRGKDFDAVIAEFGIESKDLFKGTYFQVRDKALHDDRVFFLMIQATREQLAVHQNDQLWTTRYMKEAGDMATYWAATLQLEHKHVYPPQEDNAIRVILTPGNDRITEMAAELRRSRMGLVGG